MSGHRLGLRTYPHTHTHTHTHTHASVWRSPTNTLTGHKSIDKLSLSLFAFVGRRRWFSLTGASLFQKPTMGRTPTIYPCEIHGAISQIPSWGVPTGRRGKTLTYIAEYYYSQGPGVPDKIHSKPVDAILDLSFLIISSLLDKIPWNTSQTPAPS